MRQAGVRPVTLAVAPVTATTPGCPGQLALWLGDFHIRACPGEAAFPPPGARLPATGNSCIPGLGPGDRSIICRRSWHSQKNCHAIYVTPPVQGPKRERCTLHPVPRGGFHKAGEGPAFGGLWFLSGSRKEPPAGSVPTGGAGFHQGNGGRPSFPKEKKKGCCRHSLQQPPNERDYWNSLDTDRSS